MGCDIHIFLERKVDDGNWELDPGHRTDTALPGHDDVLSIPSLAARNYLFFSVIAGVRGTEAPLYSPRGLPKDINSKLLSLFNSGDYHTATWLTIKEFKKCLMKFEKIYNKYWAHYEEPDILLRDLWNGKVEEAFNNNSYGIDDSIFKYIQNEIDVHKCEDMLIGKRPRTDLQYRLIIWFDS